MIHRTKNMKRSEKQETKQNKTVLVSFRFLPKIFAFSGFFPIIFFSIWTRSQTLNHTQSWRNKDANHTRNCIGVKLIATCHKLLKSQLFS